MCQIKAVLFTPAIQKVMEVGKSVGDKISHIVQRLFQLNEAFDAFIIATLLDWKSRIHTYYTQTVAHFITLVILPVLKISPKELDDANSLAQDDLAAINQVNGPLRAEKIVLTTEDSISLDGVYLTHKNVSTKERKVLVFFLGNNDLWQKNIAFFKALAETFKVDLLSYNYRTPNTEQDLVNDGTCQVESLIGKGVRAKNILLFGHVVGAAVSFVTAEALLDRGITVHAGGRCTFRSIQAIIKSYFPRIGNLIATFVKGFDYRLNTVKAVAKLTGKVIIVYSDHNPKIPEPAHLIPSLFPSSKNILSIAMADLGPDNHNRPYTKTEIDALKTAVQSIW